MAQMRFPRSFVVGLVFGLAGAFDGTAILLAADPPQPAKEAAEFKTPQTAETARIDALAGAAAMAKAGYLGIGTELDAKGKLIVTAVAPDSGASRAGVRVDDVVVRADGQAVASPEELRKVIRAKSRGQSLKIALRRKGKDLELAPELAALGAVGRKPPEPRVTLGVRVGEPRSGEGARVEQFNSESPAEKAGLKVGDLLLQVDGVTLANSNKLTDLLSGKKPADTVTLAIRRDGKDLEIKAPLAAETQADFGAGRGGPRARRSPTLVQPGVLRVAVIGIEFPDVKHNDKISPKDWENAYFSRNLYSTTNATGQQVYGSVNDFYNELSSGALRVDGKMLGWIEVAKNRMDYSPTPTPPSGDKGNGKGDETKPGAEDKVDDKKPGTDGQAGKGVTDKPGVEKPGVEKPGSDKPATDKPGAGKPGADKPGTDKPGPGQGADRPRGNRDALLREVLDKLIARDGKDSLDGYDAVCFIYAGKRAVRTIESVYWPHMSSMNFQNRRVRYDIIEEGGERMTSISVCCHEMGHILGLPDLYIRRQQNGSPTPVRVQNPYAESLWQWDLMAVQVNNGRPQHMSAWSKEQLGWIKPAVIDPRVRQKLVLAPIENSPNECFKIPLRADGSEYLLLENRRHVGFDASVPAEGLLIWRVVFGRPVLEAAHGVSGSAGLRSDIRNVPFPTDRGDSFTPYTKPSSAALTGDELPVFITNIHRLADGKITFSVGYGYD